MGLGGPSGKESGPAGDAPESAGSAAARGPGQEPAPGAGETAAPVACPHCGSDDVEVEAPFGGSLMTRQYWCRGCRTVFEWIRWEPDDDPGGWLDEP